MGERRSNGSEVQELWGPRVVRIKNRKAGRYVRIVIGARISVPDCLTLAVGGVVRTGIAFMGSVIIYPKFKKYVAFPDQPSSAILR
jgi:hypothetical protein